MGENGLVQVREQLLNSTSDRLRNHGLLGADEHF